MSTIDEFSFNIAFNFQTGSYSLEKDIGTVFYLQQQTLRYQRLYYIYDADVLYEL